MDDVTVLPDAPRGRETSTALTEIRTALSRAQDARRSIEHAVIWTCPNATEPNFSQYRCPVYRDMERGRTLPDYETQDRHARMHSRPDPDRDEMLAALDAFTAASLRWRRTGRPKKG